MFQVGDIIRFYAGMAGKEKYHLCLFVAPETADPRMSKFIFLNSKAGYKDEYVVPCERLPFLPQSEKGQTVFSFSMLLLHNVEKLRDYRAVKVGALDPQLAQELAAFVPKVKSLSTPDKLLVRDALRTLASGGY
jgi:hypothetical protein